ncbi:MAG: DUF6399 domain-containing protein [Methylococcales bacterium]|nr:DUF6399 domain-containing protein [Methylococcales bacterium]MDD5632428.1 DUF6399 domain-containing protein [Methylococcales bacterium]
MRCRSVAQRAIKDFNANPFHARLAECEQQRWLAWAEWMVRQYHRSSSAVEGRNGRLSQLYHNGRGVTESRLQVKHMDEIPLPRKARQRVIRNPLKLQDVPV